MEILDLLIVALMAVLKVLLVAGVGLFLSTDHIKLLGPNTTRDLNKLGFFVFNPAYMLSSLSETVTVKSLVTLWFIPVNILVSLIIGSSLELILIKLTRTPPHFYSLVVSCCSSGTLGNYLFLLVIAPAVCEMSNSPFGDSSACSSDGETCALLSMALGGIYVWTYVCAIMARFANAEINLKMVFNPTTIAAVVGLIIRIVPPIRKAMIGDNALLRLIDNSASLLGEAAIPSIILLLGANLRRGLKGSGVSPLLVVRILAVRYILLKWAHACVIQISRKHVE
ncbi:protein PIN-LIKES 1 [Citrus clementina]|uniref:protein PIN-LIKES 1 n=1 Tax=Citrus clementina TaxID=85681 RepID=UPI000CED16F2|nr:protein PIN-LIKES 1 [Citrus x clementina]